MYQHCLEWQRLLHGCGDDPLLKGFRHWTRGCFIHDHQQKEKNSCFFCVGQWCLHRDKQGNESWVSPSTSIILLTFDLQGFLLRDNHQWTLHPLPSVFVNTNSVVWWQYHQHCRTRRLAWRCTLFFICDQIRKCLHSFASWPLVSLRCNTTISVSCNHPLALKPWNDSATRSVMYMVTNWYRHPTCNGTASTYFLDDGHWYWAGIWNSSSMVSCWDSRCWLWDCWQWNSHSKPGQSCTIWQTSRESTWKRSYNGNNH